MRVLRRGAILMALFAAGCSGKPVIPAGWVAYSPADKNFSVAFPQEPQSSSGTAPTPEGVLNIRIFEVTQPTSRFTVIVAEADHDISAAESEIELKSLEQAAARTAKGQIKKSLTIDWNGHMCHEVEIRAANPAGTLYLRSFIVGKTIYALSVWEIDRTTEAHRLDFFNSFQLLKE